MTGRIVSPTARAQKSQQSVPAGVTDWDTCPHIGQEAFVHTLQEHVTQNLLIAHDYLLILKTQCLGLESIYRQEYNL